LPVAAERFTLTASALSSTKALLNGAELKVEADGSVGSLRPDHVAAGPVRMPPASITFLVVASAGNKTCM